MAKMPDEHRAGHKPCTRRAFSVLLTAPTWVSHGVFVISRTKTYRAT